MALIREAAGYKSTAKKTKTPVPSKPISPKQVGKPSIPAPATPKSSGKAPATPKSGKSSTPKSSGKITTLTAPKTMGKVAPTPIAGLKVGKVDPATLGAAPSAYSPSSGGSSYSPGGYTSGGGRYGGGAATTSQPSAIGTGAPIGSSGPTLGQTSTVGGTPSAIAQMALSTLSGSGTAPGITRRRNRAGAGYNLSLTPEQLRNIAARRIG